MVEYCVYWLENGEPMHEVFSSLAAAEMYSCAIRGKENIEWVELQRLNNYFGGRQYREVFEENRALITELKKILSR